MFTYSTGHQAFLSIGDTKHLSIDHIVSITSDADDPQQTIIVMVNGDVHRMGAKVKDVMDIVLNRRGHE